MANDTTMTADDQFDAALGLPGPGGQFGDEMRLAGGMTPDVLNELGGGQTEPFSPPAPEVAPPAVESQYEVLDGSTVSNEFGAFTGTPIPEDLKKRPEGEIPAGFEEFAADIPEGFEEFAAPADQAIPEGFEEFAAPVEGAPEKPLPTEAELAAETEGKGGALGEAIGGIQPGTQEAAEDVEKAEEFTGLRGLGASLRGMVREKKEALNKELDRLDAEIMEDEEIGLGETAKATGTMALKTLGAGASLLGEGLLDAALRTVKSIIPEAAEEKIAEKGGDALKAIGQTKAGQVGLQALSQGMEAWEGFKEKHPNAASAIGSTLQIAEVIPVGKAASLAKKPVGAAVKKTADVVGEVGERVAKKAAKEGIEAGVRKGAARRITKAKELVAESATARNQRNAFSQGRLKIDEPSKLKEFLLGTKRPEIVPSPRAQRGVDVLYERVGNVPTKPGKLFDASVKEGTKMAQDLAPKLQKIQVDDTVRSQLKKATDSIRKDVVNNEKLLIPDGDRAKLEKVLKKMDEAQNMDDVWKARIEYDMITPESVKGVDIQSGDMAVFRNSVWKDSRGQMNDVLDQVASKVDVDVKKNFDDMSSLFEMQENIIQRVPEFAKQKQGLLSKSNLIKAAIGAAGAGGVTGVLNL